MNDDRKIAYFSMEVGVDARMPTYSGGLGILAGDTIRAAADLRVPMIAVTLLYRKGYFDQSFDASGWQREDPAGWVVEEHLEEMHQRAAVTLEGRIIYLRCWRHEVRGVGGFRVPVYFLDTDLEKNSEWDRTLTDFLYGGDQHYRLCQEVILGMGGVRMLRALGYKNIERFHMNEGHSGLLVLELLREEVEKAKRESVTSEDIATVRKKCVFTTHTPVPAGHDQFPMDLVHRVIGQREVFLDLKNLVCCGDLLHLTFLALNFSHYVNGVAKRHGEVSRLIFGYYNIDSITNGVHARTWTSEPFQELYDRYIPGWQLDSFSLRYALRIPKHEVWRAHIEAKSKLFHTVTQRAGIAMDLGIFTIGFARRAATYKRGDLLFSDIERLRRIASEVGFLQVIYAGKAHPQDQGGKELIKRIFQAKEALKKDIKIVYLENYDMDMGKIMTSGVDVWLNTPQPPLEASGTSGMKAALNGVPSLSVLDGWWIEGYIEGVTGWAIGEDNGRLEGGDDHSKDATSLYDKLEHFVVPMFYQDRDRFLDVMLHSIALNGSFFNTQRMVQQYVLEAYF
jgi:starch phosphorylase